MIALDTNILLRYFDQDGGDQSRLATRLVEDALSSDEPGFVSLIVICELAWVMQRAYRQGRENIVAFIDGLISAPQFVVQESALVVEALQREDQDIADVLIHLVGQARGCLRTLTFDKGMSALEGVELLA